MLYPFIVLGTRFSAIVSTDNPLFLMPIFGVGKSGKKPKAEPSTEEMHAVVADLLEKVDFNTVSGLPCRYSFIQ